MVILVYTCDAFTDPLCVLVLMPPSLLSRLETSKCVSTTLVFELLHIKLFLPRHMNLSALNFLVSPNMFLFSALRRFFVLLYFQSIFLYIVQHPLFALVYNCRSYDCLIFLVHLHICHLLLFLFFLLLNI